MGLIDQISANYVMTPWGKEEIWGKKKKKNLNSYAKMIQVSIVVHGPPVYFDCRASHSNQSKKKRGTEGLILSRLEF